MSGKTSLTKADFLKYAKARSALEQTYGKVAEQAFIEERERQVTKSKRDSEDPDKLEAKRAKAREAYQRKKLALQQEIEEDTGRAMAAQDTVKIKTKDEIIELPAPRRGRPPKYAYKKEEVPKEVAKPKRAPRPPTPDPLDESESEDDPTVTEATATESEPPSFHPSEVSTSAFDTESEPVPPKKRYTKKAEPKAKPKKAAKKYETTETETESEPEPPKRKPRKPAKRVETETETETESEPAPPKRKPRKRKESTDYDDEYDIPVKGARNMPVAPLPMKRVLI